MKCKLFLFWNYHDQQWSPACKSPGKAITNHEYLCCMQYREHRITDCSADLLSDIPSILSIHRAFFFFKYSSLLQYLDVKKHIPDARYESLLYILFPAPGNRRFWTPNLLQAVFLVWVAYSDLVTSGVSVREGKKKKKCKLLACFFLWPRKSPCSYISL